MERVKGNPVKKGVRNLKVGGKISPGHGNHKVPALPWFSWKSPWKDSLKFIEKNGKQWHDGPWISSKTGPLMGKITPLVFPLFLRLRGFLRGKFMVRPRDQGALSPGSQRENVLGQGAFFPKGMLWVGLMALAAPLGATVGEKSSLQSEKALGKDRETPSPVSTLGKDGKREGSLRNLGKDRGANRSTSPHENRPQIPTGGPSQGQDYPGTLQPLPSSPSLEEDVLLSPLTSGPVQAQWGTPEWTSSTHVCIPLKIRLQGGWKIYGPTLAEGEVGQPTTLSWDQSQNVWHVQAHWPTPLTWKSQEHKATVYEKSMEIKVEVALRDRSPAKIKMVLSGLACSKVCQPFSIALPEEPLTPPELTWSRWWAMMGLAFLGGLILNIMPCVLPVLALKLKGLTQGGPGLLKKVCALTTGGILVGFWALALLTLVLKTLFQQQVAWGMHLQNPYFVTVMVILMMFGGCGLMGVFHINTPKWAGALVAPGGGRSPHIQSFLSGLVAVLLATPCSAPFLGTALGFALTGQGAEIFLFYTAIALGFALPYILGMIFPMDKFLPKPGAWMVTFERGLGFFLMLSAGWFVRTSLGGLLGVPWDRWALMLWALWLILPLVSQVKILLTWPRLHRTLTYALPALLSCIFMVLPALPGPVEHPISMEDGAITWRVFSSQTLEKVLAEGKIVVVDLTGMACPLCLVNKSVFKNFQVQKLLTQGNVVCLRGDFTRGDREIMVFLRKYGRSAIPFNMIISATHPKGVILSESLSVSEVVEAMEFIQGSPGAKP